MDVWSDRVKIIITVSIATCVLVVAAAITIGCIHYDTWEGKAKVACSEAPGKQWIAGKCLVVNQ